MENEKKIYSEVLGVLLTLGNDYCEKVPSKVFTFLEDNCDHENIPEYDKNTRIEDLNISEEARMFLVMLKIKYWCKDEKEREEVRNLLKDNEILYNKEIREKYDPDNIFKKDINENSNENNSDTNKDNSNSNLNSNSNSNINTNNTNDKLIKEEKESWFKRFINKIKHLFKK